MDHRKYQFSLLVAFFCYVTLCVRGSIAKCKLKVFLHRAMQTDFNGRRCWDNVTIQSCGGFCQSYEISHWQFPYKESNHPVCLHGERRHASVKLRFCDLGVESSTETYHYVEAKSCKCQNCSSEDTSCEWLPPDSSLLGSLILTRINELEDEELDKKNNLATCGKDKLNAYPSHT